MPKATYKSSGVDLESYRDSMSRLPRLMNRTMTPRVIRNDGGFAGLFQLDFDNQLFARKYQDPVLVSSTDGVGTKLKVAQRAGKHDSVGIDLVAMSVNDAICCGAEPLFFLDYVAMGQDDPNLLEQIVRGISDGCVEAECSLLGGETAIMPDIYQLGDYDLAGFCVAVAEKSQLIDGRSITEGDVVLGVASSGLHSNGFSLVRKIVFEIGGYDIDDEIDELGQTVGQILLEPTRLYARPLKHVLQHYTVKSVVHGLAHITGGGLAENIQRILPPDKDVKLDLQSWKTPPLFSWLQQLGDVEQKEMNNVFNMGIGLALLVSPFYANHIRQLLCDLKFETWTIGHVCSGTGQVHG